MNFDLKLSDRRPPNFSGKETINGCGQAKLEK